MKVDTGATLSCKLLEVVAKKKKDSMLLHYKRSKLDWFYAGVQFEVLGSFQVEVTYQEQKATLILLVVAVDGLSLLGRVWPKHIRYN